MKNPGFAAITASNNGPIFFSLFFILFLVTLNYTIPIIGGLYIASDLGGSSDIASYGISLYILGNAVGLPIGRGLIGKVNPGKLVFFLLLHFALFSWACGIAPNYPLFLVFRIFQGIVAGTFFPIAFAFFSLTIPREKRDILTTIIVTIFTVTPVLGACFGGWLAYDYDWRWPFYFNVPILVLLACFLRKRLEPVDYSSKKVNFDAIGYIFYVLGIVSLSFVIIFGQQLDWFRCTLIPVLLILGLASFVFFILWSLHHQAPILDLRLLKNFCCSFALFNLAFLFSCYFGMVILLAFWLNLWVNYTPIWISLLIGTMAIAGFFPTLLIEKGFNKIDFRIPLAIAISFFAISCFHTSIFNVEIDFARIANSRILAGLGLGLFLPPLFRLCFMSFPDDKGLDVLLLFQFVRMISSGLGAAIFTTVWLRRQVFYHERLGGQLTPFDHQTQDYYAAAKQFQLQGNSANAELNDLLDRQSTALALDDCFFLMGWLMVGLLILLCLTLVFRAKGFKPDASQT